MIAPYFPILMFLTVSVGLGIALMSLGLLFGTRKTTEEKISAYECGFEAFDDAHMKFDVRFYLVAILFIIFDLEIAFLFPWSVVLEELGAFGLVSMFIFLFLLVIGFIYEWKKGALEWE